MKFSWVGFLAIGIAIFFAGCAPKVNQYMVQSTPEYSQVTQLFVGEWNVTSIRKDDQDQLKYPFQSGKLVMDFNSQRATLTLIVRQDYVDKKLIDWKQRWPNLEVNEYKVVSTADWKISDSGEILYFDNLKNTADVIGTGENFGSFYDFEKTKFAASENVGTDGGLMGLAMNMATKQATGSKELFPNLPSQVNFKFVNANKSINLFDIFGTKIDLVKVK